MSKFEILEDVKGVLGYFSDKFKSADEKNKNYVTTSAIANKSEKQDDYVYLEEDSEAKNCGNQYDSSVEALKVNEVEREESCLIIDFKEDNIMQAFVNSEIFGKPKAKTRRRR